LFRGTTPSLTLHVFAQISVFVQVTAILRECIEPVEAAFHEEYERLERSFAVDFCKLQKVMTFNSSVDAPLSQRLLVGDGGPLSWWMTLVNEMGPGFTASMRINKQHKGFDQMVDTAVKMHLIFEDVYLPGADSPQGTWTGITVEHTYEFVFLCFMNAYAKKIDEKFQLKIKALFPGKSICHAGPVKSLQRCNEKNFSLPLLENEEPLQMYRLPRCAGLLDLNRVTLRSAKKLKKKLKTVFGGSRPSRTQNPEFGSIKTFTNFSILALTGTFFIFSWLALS
jgi:hypothetical protein